MSASVRTPHLPISRGVGFIVKVINVEPDLVLNVQELGGSDPIRQYWEKYYGGQHVIVSGACNLMYRMFSRTHGGQHAIFICVSVCVHVRVHVCGACNLCTCVILSHLYDGQHILYRVVYSILCVERATFIYTCISILTHCG